MKNNYLNEKPDVSTYQAQLYNALEKRGSLENLKTQIRANLIKSFNDDKQINSICIKKKFDDIELSKVKSIKTSICLILAKSMKLFFLSPLSLSTILYYL